MMVGVLVLCLLMPMCYNCCAGFMAVGDCVYICMSDDRDA